MSDQIREENKMGVMPVGKLLMSMSIPMMLSMLVQALYNVVDSYFVAKISQDALNAVSLSFPIQNIIIGVAVGTGVGINALLSRSLGEKNYETANGWKRHPAGDSQRPGHAGDRIDSAGLLFPDPDGYSRYCGPGYGISYHLLHLVDGCFSGDHV